MNIRFLNHYKWSTNFDLILITMSKYHLTVIVCGIGFKIEREIPYWDR